jgi:xylulokinase
MGVTNGAGLSLRWLRDTLMPGLSYDEMTAEAARVKPGSDGVIWTPYLFGERTPHLDAEARAAFVGISASTTRGHFVRAVMEGVAFSLRDTFTLFEELGIPVAEIRLGGGGARGALWRQIQADVYGRPVERLEAEEGGAFGAALLAGTGVGAWPDVETACAETIRVAEVIEPKHAAEMEKAYREYRKVYPALKAIGKA